MHLPHPLFTRAPPASAEARREARQLGWAMGCAALVVLGAAAIVFLAHRAGVPPFDLLRDPPDQFGFPVYGGAVSNLGISVLTLSAGVAGFAALFGSRTRARLATAALLSALLALDDQYMLHEYVGPEILGLPEIGFYALYMGVGLAIAASIGQGLLRLRHAALLVAALGVALSIAIDLLLPTTAYTVLAEDLAKLGGLVVWLFYWTLAAARAVAPQPSGSAARDGTAPAPFRAISRPR